jgi:hypothetical protein
MDKDQITDTIPDLVSPSAPPNTGRIPAWVLEEISKWIDGAQTGDLELHFESGTPKHFRYSGIINPLRGDVPSGYAPLRWLRGPVCPEDQATMAEIDYGERFVCSKDQRVWTYWQLIKMSAAWTPDQWAEIQKRGQGGRR